MLPGAAGWSSLLACYPKDTSDDLQQRRMSNVEPHERLLLRTHGLAMIWGTLTACTTPAVGARTSKVTLSVSICAMTSSVPTASPDVRSNIVAPARVEVLVAQFEAI